MAANGKARIALIGTGWWATYAHLPALAQRPDAEIVALANRSPDRLKLAADKFHVTNTYTDYHEMLGHEALDGVIISSQQAVHYDMAEAALKHGHHILLEKPMVLRPTEAAELLELAAARERAIVMSYPWNFTAHARLARKTIRSGELGEVQHVSILFTSAVYEGYRGDTKTLDWFFGEGGLAEAPVMRPRDNTNTELDRGGGQGYVQITHSAALVFWVTGLSAQRVSAYMSNLDVAVDVVDGISVQLSNGAIAVLSSTGNLRPFGPGQHLLHVHCSRGHLVLDAIAGTLTISGNDGTVASPSPLSEEEIYPRFAPANNLVDVILGKSENLSPGENGALVVDFLDAAYRSASDGGVPVGVSVSKL